LEASAKSSAPTRRRLSPISGEIGKSDRSRLSPLAGLNLKIDGPAAR
jgi:hypothetical protein